VWDLGEWGTDEGREQAEDEARGVARWGDELPDRTPDYRTLGQDLVDAIRIRQGKRTPADRNQAVLLEALARDPLLVSPWVADPEVRQKVSLFHHTPNGRVVLEVVVPILCRFALRLAWDEVVVPLDGNEKVPFAVVVHQLAAELRTRAMAHLVRFLAEVEPDSAVKLAEIPPADRERMLSGMLRLRDLLGPGWRRRREAMLDCKAGALRTWRWRAKRKVTQPRKSIRGKSRS
jgi:hypothetical protein